MNEKPEALRLAQRLRELANLEANELVECMDYAAAELRRLHAENEALRKDAERYRWLAWTSDTQPIVIYEIVNGQILFGNKANDVIDAAMKVQP